jgi:hypothetical protein
VSTQSVEVEIRIDAAGKIVPLRVRWNGRWAQVAQTSRTWSDEAGEHFLIMILPERVLDLIRTPEGLWQAHEPGGGRGAVI